MAVPVAVHHMMVGCVLCVLSFLRVIVKLVSTPFDGCGGSAICCWLVVIVAFAGVGGL